MTDQGAADRALFPPESIVEIKALACELPVRLGLPFFPSQCGVFHGGVQIGDKLLI